MNNEDKSLVEGGKEMSELDYASFKSSKKLLENEILSRTINVGDRVRHVTGMEGYVTELDPLPVVNSDEGKVFRCDPRTLTILYGKKHDHTCYCGTGNSVPHQIGKSNCIRFMTEAPDLRKATLFTYTQQRGFHRHPCGCWSRYPGSDNSIK